MSFSIEIKDLCKTYQPSKKNVLNSINLDIKKGSFFGLLGPNGAGKSTIINIIAGIVNKTSGTVKISGIDIDKNHSFAKKHLGIVPQELIADPFFTVYETLEIYAGYYGLRKSERRTDEIIDALGLSDKRNTKPRSLSGGMKRRLLVAKALVHNPDILILDEPTAGVDVELRTQLWDYIKKINKSGTTILLTTHYLEEAENLCDEIAVINKGNIIARDKKTNLVNILDNKEIIIDCNNPREAVRYLQDFNTNILSDTQISIIYESKKNIDEISIPMAELIIKKLLDNNIKILDIKTKQPNLEEVFKFLINK